MTTPLRHHLGHGSRGTVENGNHAPVGGIASAAYIHRRHIASSLTRQAPHLELSGAVGHKPDLLHRSGSGLWQTAHLAGERRFRTPCPQPHHRRWGKHSAAGMGKRLSRVGGKLRLHSVVRLHFAPLAVVPVYHFKSKPAPPQLLLVVVQLRP